MPYDTHSQSAGLAAVSQQRAIRTARQRRWAEGYLTGIARAFRRGNVTERAVCGAIGMAIIRGVDAEMVTRILAPLHLEWDVAAGRVVKTDQVHKPGK
jgi:hypothetical protein